MSKRMKEFKARIQANKRMSEFKLYKEMEILRRKEDLEACEEFLQDVQTLLKGRYELIGSCNRDISRYLIPIGTESKVTYYGKPEKSFRISDHWNWYSNTKKCRDFSYVQCESVDMPKARERKDEYATKPRKGLQVAIQGTDGKYHHVFGYKWNSEHEEFEWVSNNPMDICKEWGLIV